MRAKICTRPRGRLLSPEIPIFLPFLEGPRPAQVSQPSHFLGIPLSIHVEVLTRVVPPVCRAFGLSRIELARFLSLLENIRERLGGVL